MEIEAVKAKIIADIEDAQVSVEGEDCSFSVTVISEQFRGKSPVACQKMVMAPFKELIATGELHALSVKTLTPE